MNHKHVTCLLVGFVGYIVWWKFTSTNGVVDIGMNGGVNSQ